jgi:hypothetical protein
VGQTPKLAPLFDAVLPESLLEPLSPPMFGQFAPLWWCGAGVPLEVPGSAGVLELPGSLLVLPESLLDDGVCANDGVADVSEPTRNPRPSAPATPMAANVFFETDGWSAACMSDMSLPGCWWLVVPGRLAHEVERTL